MTLLLQSEYEQQNLQQTCSRSNEERKFQRSDNHLVIIWQQWWLQRQQGLWQWHQLWQYNIFCYRSNRSNNQPAAMLVVETVAVLVLAMVQWAWWWLQQSSIFAYQTSNNYPVVMHGSCRKAVALAMAPAPMQQAVTVIMMWRRQQKQQSSGGSDSCRNGNDFGNGASAMSGDDSCNNKEWWWRPHQRQHDGNCDNGPMLFSQEATQSTISW